MASNTFEELGREHTLYLAHDGVNSASDGNWIDATYWEACGIHVTLLEAGGTVVVHGSNAFDKPSDATAGVALATINTAGASMTHLQLGVKLPVRWIKFQRTVGGGPTNLVCRVLARLKQR